MSKPSERQGPGSPPGGRNMWGMRRALLTFCRREIRKVCEEMEEDEMRDELCVDFEVAVSEVDRDPYTIMHPQMLGW